MIFVAVVVDDDDDDGTMFLEVDCHLCSRFLVLFLLKIKSGVYV